MTLRQGSCDHAIRETLFQLDSWHCDRRYSEATLDRMREKIDYVKAVYAHEPSCASVPAVICNDPRLLEEPTEIRALIERAAEYELEHCECGCTFCLEIQAEVASPSRPLGLTHPTVLPKHPPAVGHDFGDFIEEGDEPDQPGTTITDDPVPPEMREKIKERIGEITNDIQTAAEAMDGCDHTDDTDEDEDDTMPPRHGFEAEEVTLTVDGDTSEIEEFDYQPAEEMDHSPVFPERAPMEFEGSMTVSSGEDTPWRLTDMDSESESGIELRPDVMDHAEIVIATPDDEKMTPDDWPDLVIDGERFDLFWAIVELQSARRQRNEQLTREGDADRLEGSEAEEADSDQEESTMEPVGEVDLDPLGDDPFWG